MRVEDTSLIKAQKQQILTKKKEKCSWPCETFSEIECFHLSLKLERFQITAICPRPQKIKFNDRFVHDGLEEAIYRPSKKSKAFRLNVPITRFFPCECNLASLQRPDE